MSVSPSAMNDSTRRALRTLYQNILGILIALPILAGAAVTLPESFPFRAQIVGALVTAAAAAAAASKVINELEDRGIIRAFLYPSEASATGLDPLVAATDNGSRPGDGEQPSQDPDAFPLWDDEGAV